MALKARVKTVTTDVPVTDNEGNPTGETIDLLESGDILIVVEYVDDGAPQTILRTKTFQVPSTLTEEDIAARITGYATSVLRTIERRDQLAQYVGALLDIPEPGA